MPSFYLLISDNAFLIFSVIKMPNLASYGSLFFETFCGKIIHLYHLPVCSCEKFEIMGVDQITAMKNALCTK